MQQGLRLVRLLAVQARGRLFAQVMRQPAAEIALFGIGEFLRDLRCVRPIAAAFIVGQQGQSRLRFKRGSFELEQGCFRAVDQAGLEKVQRQGMLGTLPVCQAQVAAREQMFVDPHRTFIFAAPAEQVAQGEVQFGGVRIVLNGLDEGVDGLVLLLVEQEIEAFEVGLGGLPVLDSQLTQVETRGQPAQHKGQGQAQQDPAQVKVHAGQSAARLAPAA